MLGQNKIVHWNNASLYSVVILITITDDDWWNACRYFFQSEICQPRDTKRKEHFVLQQALTDLYIFPLVSYIWVQQVQGRLNHGIFFIFFFPATAFVSCCCHWWKRSNGDNAFVHVFMVTAGVVYDGYLSPWVSTHNDNLWSKFHW